MPHQRSLQQRRHRQSSICKIPLLLFLAVSFTLAGATDVQWQANNDVAPEHKDAHTAPRSQKYWDEHNIKRPDYAKTDAEIRAERREKGDGGGGWGWTFVVLLALIPFVAGAAAWYGFVTGDWEAITNNPVGRLVTRIMEKAGASGHTLGSSATPSRGGDSEEAKRAARLARFDQRDTLDAMKAE